MGKSKRKREKWEEEKEEDGDKKIDYIEALGYDQLLSIRGSQASPDKPSQTHDLKFRNEKKMGK